MDYKGYPITMDNILEVMVEAVQMPEELYQQLSDRDTNVLLKVSMLHHIRFMEETGLTELLSVEEVITGSYVYSIELLREMRVQAARMVKSVDTRDLKSLTAKYFGSNPNSGTNNQGK